MTTKTMIGRNAGTTTVTTATVRTPARRFGLAVLALGLTLAGVGLRAPHAAHATLWTACASNVGAGAAVGGCAPTFTLADVQSRAVALAHFRGHPVLINFWGVGCAYCAQELPDLKGFADAFLHRGGIILGVNAWGEPRELIAGYARTRGVGWPLLPDGPGTVGSLYAVRGTPTNVFIDRGGVIRAIAVGPLTLAGFQQRARGL